MWIDQAKDLEKKKYLGNKRLKVIAHCDKSKQIEWRTGIAAKTTLWSTKNFA
jgi:hypothetical protein